VDADLEDAYRRKVEIILHPILRSQALHLRLQVPLAGQGEGEPEVVGVVSGIVVADAGVSADPPGHLVEPFRFHPKGDQCTPVAEATGVEDRADLPDHSCLLEPPDPGQHLLFPDVQPSAQGGEGGRL